jgi:hypothetical protein
MGAPIREHNRWDGTQAGRRTHFDEIGKGINTAIVASFRSIVVIFQLLTAAWDSKTSGTIGGPTKGSVAELAGRGGVHPQ